MNIYIRSNNFTDVQVQQAVACIASLNGQGHRCSVSRKTSILLYGDESHHLFDPEGCDLIVSLGGDGALLRACETAVRAQKPLIGINSGRLGYLCSLSFDEVDRFNEIFADCYVSERSLLELNVNGKQYRALNDVVISKNDFGKTVDLSLELQKGKLIGVRGDGLIICTPTGSTAYNLSAGGPRLSEDASVFAITPICAHDKNTYPRVVRDDLLIRVHVNHESAGVYADGEYAGDITEVIEIRRADRSLSLYLKK